MPTVNNRGRLFWGSAWRLEPRRGNWPVQLHRPFFRRTACAGQARGETSAGKLGCQDLHLFNGWLARQ
jgi:hypothetical protein